MWGFPKTEEEVASVFVNFLSGKIMAIPWISADDVAPETHRMVHDLIRINRHGFFSINSQPAVNGVPSTDPDVGWGTWVYLSNDFHFMISLCLCVSSDLALLPLQTFLPTTGAADARGYVFQKAYIEFFTSPFLLKKLLKVHAGVAAP